MLLLWQHVAIMSTLYVLLKLFLHLFTVLLLLRFINFLISRVDVGLNLLTQTL